MNVINYVRPVVHILYSGPCSSHITHRGGRHTYGNVAQIWFLSRSFGLRLKDLEIVAIRD